MYSVGAHSSSHCKPFLHSITLLSTTSNPIQLNALFDDGAMISAMSMNVYNRVRDQLGGWHSSQRHLRMADGSIVPSIARWEGIIILGSSQCHGQFEVFDSNGSWSFLFGKPLLQAFEAVHDYKTDVIKLPGGQPSDVLSSSTSTPATPGPAARCKDYEWEAFNWDKRATLAGGLTPPLREVLHVTHNIMSQTNIDTHALSDQNEPRPVCHITEDGADLEYDEGAEVHVDDLLGENPIFCRASAPFKPERVARILRKVEIGPDLTDSEHKRVEALISCFADCFALSVSEVLPIPDACTPP